jgi:hypothetical protein
MIDLWRVHKVQVLDHGVTHNNGIFTVHAIAEPAIISRLEHAGYQVAVYEDVDALGKERQAEVSKGNRFLRQ